MENVDIPQSFISEMDEIIGYINGDSLNDECGSRNSEGNTALAPQYHNTEDINNESYPENWYIPQDKQNGLELNAMDSSPDNNIAVMEHMDVDYEQSFVDTAISGPESNRKERIGNIENARKARDEVMGVVIPVNIVNLLQSKDTESNENDKTQQTPKKRRKRDRPQTCLPRIKKHLSYVGVKCQVCGGRAVGFHYGVDTCAACKIFFYRNSNRILKHLCSEPSSGVDLHHPCPRCRMEKCFTLGMSVAASKKGRYSYKKRYEYVLKSEQQKDDTIQEIPPHPVSVVDEAVILGSRISDLFSSCISYPVNFYDELSGYRNVSMIEDGIIKIKLQSRPPYSAYHDNSSFFNHLPGPKRDIYRDRFLQLQKNLITYAKFLRQLPAFTSLEKADQHDLFRGNMVFLRVISEYRAYDLENGLEIFPDGMVFTKQEIRQYYNPDYQELLFSIAEKLHKLQLDENEQNLLKLVGFFIEGRCKTADGKRMVAKHQDTMIRTFDHLMRKNRPNSETAAVVIGNAIQILGDILLFKEEAANDFHRNFRITSDVNGWLKRTLQHDIPLTGHCF